MTVTTTNSWSLSIREARIAIDTSLNEWGLQKGNTSHRSFSSRITREVLSMCQPHSQEENPLLKRLEELQENKLPASIEGAIKHVLVCDLISSENDREFMVLEDTLDLPFPPFHRSHHQTLNKAIKYCLRPYFAKFTALELNPLSRFSKRALSQAEDFKMCWSDADSLGGSVLEATVACHLVHKESCHHCKTRSMLRWNGGREDASSWNDVVCLGCKSTFEIKSKRDIKTVERELRFNNIRGGSFRTWSTFAPLGKRYLVLVSRTPSVDRSRCSFPWHSVMVAQIDSVRPSIKSATFVDYQTESSSKTLSIGSIVRVEKSTITEWCVARACELSAADLAQEVYEEYFGHGSWKNDGCEEHAGERNGSRVNTRKIQATSLVAKKTDVKSSVDGQVMDNLQGAFESMKVRKDQGSTQRR